MRQEMILGSKICSILYITYMLYIVIFNVDLIWSIFFLVFLFTLKRFLPPKKMVRDYRQTVGSNESIDKSHFKSVQMGQICIRSSPCLPRCTIPTSWLHRHKKSVHQLCCYTSISTRYKHATADRKWETKTKEPPIPTLLFALGSFTAWQCSPQRMVAS